MASQASSASGPPVGYRFHPTDEELISFYLKNKMMGNDSEVQLIPEVDVCKYEPWEMPRLSPIESGDSEWFFFCSRDCSYLNGKKIRRNNRATGAGFWKSTGVDRKIKARRTKEEIGTKKTLVFYKGRVPRGVRTSWVMHEYHPIPKFPYKRMFVVCRLKKKDEDSSDVRTYYHGETSDSMASGFGNLAAEDASPEAQGGILSRPTLSASGSVAASNLYVEDTAPELQGEVVSRPTLLTGDFTVASIFAVEEMASEAKGKEEQHSPPTLQNSEDFEFCTGWSDELLAQSAECLFNDYYLYGGDLLDLHEPSHEASSYILSGNGYEDCDRALKHAQDPAKANSQLFF